MEKNYPIVDPVRLKSLLKSMLDLYSPSGKEEELLEFLSDYMASQGLPVSRQRVDERRVNLLVMPEDPEKVTVCWIGHVDTIAAYDLAEFGFREEGDTVYGVGSADMKGGCAAMIEAFTALAQSGDLPPSVGLALVVDEEDDKSGARVLCDEYDFPWAIVGEPTNLVPCLGHYGYLEAMLRTRGKRAHPALPEQGQNALASMLKVLLRVNEFAATRSGELVYNVRDLSVFPLGFVIPDNCEVWLDLHVPPNSRIDLLKSDLEGLVSEFGAAGPLQEVELRFEETHAGYQISADRGVVQTLKGVYEAMGLAWNPGDFRSDSDGNVLWAAGVNPIILGPGRLEDAHTPEESVSFDQVTQAATLYLRMALELAGETGRPEPA